MKTVYLVRHAKASWEMDVSDWQRPLTKAGIDRAQEVANDLKAKKIKPGKFISSYAFRALNTAVLFAHTLNFPVDGIEVTECIYEKKAIDMLDMLRIQNDEISDIMLFGHNPTITELYNMLTRKLLLKLTTSSVACIQFNLKKWKDLGNISGKTLFIATGK